jgi:predicted SAM-dependent methyltransferase
MHEINPGGAPIDPVEEAMSNLQHETEVARTSQQTRERFEHFTGKTQLKLHLGCGPDVRPGWINIDINLQANDTVDNSDFFNYDLRLGIPLPDDSCSLIYSSHFFEHLKNSYGFRLFQECRRVLRRGGRLRLALPNYRRFFQQYLNNDRSAWSLLPVAEIFPDFEEATLPFGDMVDWGIFQWGEHVTFYDEDRTIRILRAVGFPEACVSEYIEGIDLPDEVRRQCSFYIEAAR